MKKILSILAYFLLTMSSRSQSIQIGVGGGLTTVVGHEYYTNELKGTVFQEYFGSPNAYNMVDGLNFNSEYNYGIKARLILTNIPFNISGEIYFNSLRGRGTIAVSPSPISSFMALQNVESRCDLINACISAEYELLEKGIIPFLSSGVVLSYMGDIKVKSIDDYHFEGKLMDGGLRYGLDVGFGFYYNITTNISIGASSKYTVNNLIGRKESEEIINTVKTCINVLYEI